MMNNYFVFGGVRRDIFDLEDVDEFLKILTPKLKDYENLITENPIFLQRTKDKGILEPEVALNNSITGPNLRASGIGIDFRKNDYLYCGFYHEPVVLKGKDAWARYKARIEEMRQSGCIVRQALEYLKKDEPLKQKLVNPLKMKLPAGEFLSQIEAPRGLARCYIKSTGEDKPYRLKWRTGSYYAVNLLKKLLKGAYLNDAIAIAGSLDIILPEVDK